MLAIGRGGDKLPLPIEPNAVRSPFLLKYTPLAIWSVLALSLSAFAADKPNIIVIMADDMGYGDAGFTGQGYQDAESG